MKGVSVFFLLALCASWCSAQFLNHRPFPTYSLENMPDTQFSCRDKILGGYYADADTQCQMFHICVKVAGVGVQDFRFLCPNGTAFDQDHQICADWEDVDCDATTLYYSSDNFDLYRIGSGFESKAVKYGEDEETFALQRAETGDARLNREHQAQRVNQQTQEQFRKNRPQQHSNRPSQNRNNNQQQQQQQPEEEQQQNQNANNNQQRNQNHNNNNQNQQRSQNVNNNNQNQQRPQNVNNNNQNQQRPQNVNNNNQNQQRPQNVNNNNQNQQTSRPQNNNNNDRDIFRGSSSSSFFNNRNGGKETDDEDYDDNINANQNRDNFQRRKVNQRKPVNRRPVENNDNYETPTVRPHQQPRTTSFTNNFAGSSYIPTTLRPSLTTLNDEQYSSAVNNHNHRGRNGGQRHRVVPQENVDSSTPGYTVSSPAPFKQTQQYRNPPQRQHTVAQTSYNPTTQTSSPQKSTENYPASVSAKQKFYSQTENYPTVAANNFNSAQYDIVKVKPQKESHPTTVQKPSSVAPRVYSTQYDVPRVKQQQKENYPSTTTPASKTYNTQYDVPNNKVKQQQQQQQKENYPSTIYQRQSTPAPNNNNKVYNTQYDIPKVKQQKDNYPTTTTQQKQSTPSAAKVYNTQYDVPKVKQTENYPAPFSKQTTPFTKQHTNENYPVTTSTLAPTRVQAGSKSSSNFAQTQYNSNNNNNNNNNNYPSTFAPRTNSGYTQISQQTTQYKPNKPTTTFNNQQQYESQRTTNNNNQASTPRTTPVFTQYTPTVPKISSTTPVAARANRYDETQYDDGSYSSKYDRTDDEFLKTAHSQNIASSRNEYAKSTKNSSPSTQKPYYESPRPFSVSVNTPKASTTTQQVTPKNGLKPVEVNKQQPQQQQQQQQRQPDLKKVKKTKDVSYDYAYYDTNVGSEPDYDVDTTDIKKSSVKN